MSKYKLMVMYPSSNNSRINQAREVTVEANRVYTKDGAYFFVESDGKYIACYPIQYTIIDNIER